jgi:tetratricopeptide (TPR) repeat protein
MLHRHSMRFPFVAALAAALIAASTGAWSAPADDLKEAQKLYSQGKVQPAMDKVDAVLKAQPKDPQARFLKGLLLTEQKKTADAIAVFTSLTEDYPELPEPYNNLAVLYAQQGNYDKAKAALELAIHTHPSYATAHENLGDVYAQLASRAYDRALQLDKNNTAAQVKLAMVKDLFSSQKGGATPARPAPPKPEPAPPKPEPAPAKAEPAKTEPAKTEPPKVAQAEPKAAPKPAPAAPVTPAPGKGDPGQAKAGAQLPPGPSSTSADARGDEKARITAAIEAWARAWSTKDMKGYFAAYAPEFEVPGGETRTAWEKQRTERIEKPRSIEVGVKVLSIDVAGSEARATVRQSYKSDTLRNSTTKTLTLLRSGDRWLIKQEKVGG